VTAAASDRLKPYYDLAEVATLLQALECRGNLVDRKSREIAGRMA